MAPIRDWTGAITFFPHIPPHNSERNYWVHRLANMVKFPKTITP